MRAPLPWIVPASTFGLAILLSLTLASPPAQARRAAADPSKPCACQLEIRHTDASLSWAREPKPFRTVTNFDLDISCHTFAEKKKDAAPATLTVRATVDIVLAYDVEITTKQGKVKHPGLISAIEAPVPPIAEHPLECPGTTYHDSFFTQLDGLLAGAKKLLEDKHSKEGGSAVVTRMNFTISLRTVHWKIHAEAKCGLATLKKTLRGDMRLWEKNEDPLDGIASGEAPEPKKK